MYPMWLRSVPTDSAAPIDRGRRPRPSVRTCFVRSGEQVRTLEGTLADYNIAMDKQRQGSDVAELHGYIREYDARNKAFAKDIDMVFLAKQQEEKAIGSTEEQIEQMYRKNQEKINAMEPAQAEQYRALVQESQVLQDQCAQHQSQIDQVADQVAMLTAQRDGNTLNKEFRQLESQQMKLSRQMQSLEEEAEVAKLDPKEMQAKMLAKVKADTDRSKQMDMQIKDMRGENRKAEQVLAELTQDLTDRSNGNNEKDKYEKLYQRDREMSEFIDTFDQTQGEIKNDQDGTQSNIVGLLEHISSGLDAEGSMPSKERLSEMKDEASFKERQLESSQATMQRLQQERTQRVAEMEKIQNLDEKIKIELSSLQAKMDSMKDEMSSFDDLEGLRQRALESKTYLQEQLDSYQKRTKTSKEQVKGLSASYESAKKQLEASETHTRLESLEKKLRTYAQNIFTLQEYVETKGRETDFESLKNNCVNICGNLNNLAKENMNNQAQNLSDAPLSNFGQQQGMF